MQELSPSVIFKARDRLLRGDVVAVPSETVYGLAAAIDLEAGIRKIFELKHRPFFDPLIVHVSSLAQAKSVTSEWPAVADFLGRFFWPGPLTLVLKKSSRVSDLISSGLDTVAVRFPNHPYFIDIIEAAGQPLAAPSANQFGKTSPTTAEHVKGEFPDEDLLIIDGGPCEVGVESTIISFGRDTKTGCSATDVIRILRPGRITEDNLVDALTRWSPPTRVEYQQKHQAPGHLEHHYMPSIPILLIHASDSINALQRELVSHFETLPAPLEPLELGDNPSLAARMLYSQLRELSEGGHGGILVRINDHSTNKNWADIWDRLSRAASWKSERAQKALEKVRSS